MAAERGFTTWASQSLVQLFEDDESLQVRCRCPAADGAKVNRCFLIRNSRFTVQVLTSVEKK